MNSKAGHLALGAAGEELAAAHLAKLGWRILERNWRPEGQKQGLELDIIARARTDLVFVEVKTRSFCRAGLAVPVYAAFSPQKAKRFVRAAGYYLTAKGLWACPCRFDLICVQQGPDGRMELEHHKNVIETGNFMDSGNPAWQPW